eukprot:XP_011679743.1 PREDICTED: maltase-glucoamylase, intestinal-like [Strongylocentrotus purpuratus]
MSRLPQHGQHLCCSAVPQRYGLSQTDRKVSVTLSLGAGDVQQSGTFGFAMYTDDTFTTKVNSSATDVPVNQRAYFAVEATTAADQRVVIDSCWTTPTTDEDSRRYNLITDGAVQNLTEERSLVVTRSTVPSSGMYSGHWLGDNGSNWPQLRYSIIGTLEFNLFGIPHVGADICGFFNDSPEDLCRRWHQVGAFYPYARNHNGIRYQPQDPAFYGREFAEHVRDILHIRYRMLPYLYTLFYYAHTQGSTVVRSLMHEFTHDSQTWGIDRQFMWGPALLISPVLEENTLVVRAYFPLARWYDYYEGLEMPEESLTVGGGIDLEAPLEYLPLHIRGGHIIPTQQPHNSTKFSRLNPFGLIVPLDGSMQASGDLFWDDGDSIGTVESGEYYLMRYIFSSHILTSSFVHVPASHPSTMLNNLTMDDITIYGLERAPSIVKFNGAQLGTGNFEFNEDTKVLSVASLEHPMTSVFTLAIELAETV